MRAAGGLGDGRVHALGRGGAPFGRRARGPQGAYSGPVLLWRCDQVATRSAAEPLSGHALDGFVAGERVDPVGWNPREGVRFVAHPVLGVRGLDDGSDIEVAVGGLRLACRDEVRVEVEDCLVGYFRVLNCASEKGLSSLTWGRLSERVTPRSASSCAVHLLVIGAPRSECRVSVSSPLPTRKTTMKGEGQVLRSLKV